MVEPRETTDITERLRDPTDGWSGDAFAVSAEDAAEGASEIDRLRVLEETLAQLHDGRSAVLPKTKQHAEHLYTVAVACLKSFGDDPEAEIDSLRLQLSQARGAALEEVERWNLEQASLLTAEAELRTDRPAEMNYYTRLMARAHNDSAAYARSLIKETT